MGIPKLSYLLYSSMEGRTLCSFSDQFTIPSHDDLMIDDLDVFLNNARQLQASPAATVGVSTSWGYPNSWI